MALTAPRPSNTAPKHSAARMIHINMQDTLSVLRNVSSSTCLVNLRFQAAARQAAQAPVAELSTRLVTPVIKRPITENMMSSGMTPAPSSLIFAASGMARSEAASGGPRRGCN